MGLKKNNPGCGCCGGVACSFCATGTTPATVQVTLTGTGDGSCDNCSTLDGTYVLSQIPSDSCQWSYTTEFFVQTCGLDPPVARTWQFLLKATLTGGWQLEIGLSGQTPDTIFAIAITSPFNCSLPRTLTRTQQGTACTFPSTISITPL